MRIRKRIISAVTVSALGLGTIMIPHADAQVVGDSARLGGGQKIVLEGNPDAPTNTRVYTTSDGREWPMKLVPRRTNNANEYDANGEPIYDWKIVTKPGDFSTDYQLKWEAVAVVDPSLYDYSKQAFLQDFAVGDSPTWGQVQHWGDKNTRFWRPIMTSAEPLHNVKMTFTTSDKNSKFDFQTVNGTGFEASGHGQSQVRLVNDKENWLAYGELNYNSPAFTGDSAVEFDESIGARVVKGQDLPYGGKIINPGKQLFWNVVQIDDNTIEATIPYWPAGTHAVLQVRETLDAAGVDIKSAFATMRVTADKFHYEPTTVQQGSEKRVEPPVDYADPNYVGPPADTKFIRSAETPDWVEVDLDGKLTVSPDANVKPGDYQVPVVCAIRESMVTPFQT
ncbi:MAG: Rib/alpha-like domain-containing protein [Corynebacterium sp.]|nr:Rib/alpha-like domain-containing protein [Corynebacterium sp.]